MGRNNAGRLHRYTTVLHGHSPLYCGIISAISTYLPQSGKRRIFLCNACDAIFSETRETVSKRFCKRQQMQRSKWGASLLLQIRVKTLNCALGAVCKRWDPDMEVEELPDAA